MLTTCGHIVLKRALQLLRGQLSKLGIDIDSDLDTPQPGINGDSWTTSEREIRDLFNFSNFPVTLTLSEASEDSPAGYSAIYPPGEDHTISL